MFTKIAYSFLLLFSFQSILAIDATYDGAEGIRAQILEPNCLTCHTTGFSFFRRLGAPSSVNFDTYQVALESADRIVARRNNMPPTTTNPPRLTETQRDALLAWQKAGFPEKATATPEPTIKATFTFNDNILKIPTLSAVDIGFFAADLKIIAESPFVLEVISLTELEQNIDTPVASFVNNDIGIPDLEVSDGNQVIGHFNVILRLINTEPFQFNLIQAREL